MENIIEVKSATLSANKEWYNITTSNNRQYSVAANKNPKLKEVIENAQSVPYMLAGNITVKNGKTFLWDGNSEKRVESPIQQQKPQLNRTDLLIVAQCCLKSVCVLYAGQVRSFDTIIGEADKAFNWVMSKAN